MKQNIVVLGSTGQVGWAITKELDSFFQVITMNRENIPFERRNVLKANIRDILYTKTPSHIVNAAAFTNVDDSEENKELAFLINAFALQDIVDEINLYNLTKKTKTSLIHFSTDYVFDGESIEENFPTDKTNPINVYGRSKALGETIIKKSGVPYLILRTSWVISPFRKNFLKTMVKKIMKGLPIEVVDDQYGAPTSAKYIASFINHYLRNEKFSAIGGLHHICGLGKTTWFDFAKFILENLKNKKPELVKEKIDIKPIKTSSLKLAAKRPKNSKLNCDSLSTIFKFKQIDWQTQVLNDLNTMITEEHLD